MPIRKIRIACLQLEAKPFSKEQENKENILQYIAKAAELKPDLIVLPECIYPCYFLSSRIIPDYQILDRLIVQFLAEVKALAQKYHTFLAVGVPEVIPEKKLFYNSAILIDDKGEEIGRARKSFLWHFDNIWFQSGTDFTVLDTKIGKIGMFICADGRAPEIARILSLKGAEVLLDLTNLVTTGLDRKTWTNPQVDYMIPTRALENKVWIVLANKVGIEEKSIQCCGKSALFSPEGKPVKFASTDQEEILFQEIDLSESQQKTIDNAIDVFQSRRPELYHYLTAPANQLPLSKKSKMMVMKETKNPFAALIQIAEPPDMEFSTYLSQMEYFFHTLEEQRVTLLSFSQLKGLSGLKSRSVIDLLKELTKKSSVLCSIALEEQEDTKRYKTNYLFRSGQIVGIYRKTHLEFSEKDKFIPGKDDFRVFKTPYGTIGMMLDYEGYFPEIARILALKGADIIIWSSQFSHDEHLKISQTRGAENKIFIICSNSIQPECNGNSIIVSPSGQIIAGCLEDQEIASCATISLCLAQDKTIVPGTDVVLGRQPESYRLLTSPNTMLNLDN